MRSLTSLLLLAFALVLMGCNGPLFETSGMRLQFKDDGRGVAVYQLIGKNENFLGATITHQSTASIPPEEVGTTEPSIVNFNIKSFPILSYQKKGGELESSKFKIDGVRQSLAGGPWIYYFSDHSEYIKIPVDPSDSAALKKDLEELDLFELVEKWCLINGV